MTGAITVDTIPSLTMTLAGGSRFEGSIDLVESTAGGQALGTNAVLTIDEGCTWKLTGNSLLTTLTNNGMIDFDGYTITLADDTVLEG